jgi:cyclophilin family peptidyl-prolyl cis-trans isomerase
MAAIAQQRSQLVFTQVCLLILFHFQRGKEGITLKFRGSQKSYFHSSAAAALNVHFLVCCLLVAGLSFDEGTFGVFGYVTDGMPIVSKLETGDTIVSAKVVAGLERLVRPEASSNGSGQ